MARRKTLKTTAADTRPTDPDLDTAGDFAVTPRISRGYLRATPGQAWGFHYESDEPVLSLFLDIVRSGVVDLLPPTSGAGGDG